MAVPLFQLKDKKITIRLDQLPLCGSQLCFSYFPVSGLSNFLGKHKSQNCVHLETEYPEQDKSILYAPNVNYGLYLLHLQVSDIFSFFPRLERILSFFPTYLYSRINHILIFFYEPNSLTSISLLLSSVLSSLQTPHALFLHSL